MELTGYGTIKLTDKIQIMDKKTGKEITLRKFYIQADDGTTLFLWSTQDWAEYLDVPACFLIRVGNKGKGLWAQIAEIMPREKPENVPIRKK